LLRVLQDKEFYMVGSKKPEKVNVRVVAASNVDLMEMVKKGLFREDLYYRLYIITIQLPPLRERSDDIELLTSHFLTKYAKELGKEEIRFTDKALKALKAHDWPGNVRELQNLIHRLTILVEDDTIDVPDLPEAFRYSAYQDRGTDRPLVEIEQEYIMKVLGTHRNNISRAARTLGIDRKTLREKIKRIRKDAEE
ncbi:MAG TPA: sigma 54-interacting transcriptional regulator, partial [Cyclobacteriaceae bacterium]|nr:sigma 54-interacting transcriptional regulator [Cyclobacteriaceae bacterium]